VNRVGGPQEPAGYSGIRRLALRAGGNGPLRSSQCLGINVIALNVCQTGPDTAFAKAAAILAADVHVALRTGFIGGKGGNRLFRTSASGSACGTADGANF
jgi:hypothetical protein